MRCSREGRELFARFDLVSYSQKVFGMFGGEEEEIRIICKNEIVGVMIDRFGKDVYIRSVNEDSFVITVKVHVSQQFFGWLFALGNKVRIESPSRIVKQFEDQIHAVLECYK